MGGDAGPAAVLARLDAGDEVPEGVLVRCLRSPACPRALAERLAACHWVRSLRRALPLLVRHPRWGAARAVVDAALRSPALPFGVALGLLAPMPHARLAALATSPELPAPLREPAAELLARREAGERGAHPGGAGAGAPAPE